MLRNVLSSRGRFLLLQSVLCLVLVATLGLAAAVSHFRLRILKVDLAPPTELEGFWIRGPRTWTVRRVTDGVIFDESASKGPRRRLEVWRAQTRLFLSPLEYLVRSGD